MNRRCRSLSATLEKRPVHAVSSGKYSTGEPSFVNPEGTETMFKRTKLDTSFNNTCPGGVADDEIGEDPFWGLPEVCCACFCWPIKTAGSPVLKEVLTDAADKLETFAMLFVEGYQYSN